MLVLLVIFMVTAPLITPGEIELPSVGSTLTTPVAPIEIQINARRRRCCCKEGVGVAVRVVARRADRAHQARQQTDAGAAGGDRRRQGCALRGRIDVLDLLQRNSVSKVGLLARRQPG